MTELKLEIKHLDNFICCMILTKDYGQMELSKLFAKQFELYGKLREYLVIFAGKFHPSIDQFDGLLFERQLQVTLFLKGIRPLPESELL